MKNNFSPKIARILLRLMKRKVRAAVSWDSYIKAMIGVNEIALEELELYAVYDPNILNVAIAIAIFKPIEYLLEIVFGLFACWWQCDCQK
jgi:hypothetical protein